MSIIEDNKIRASNLFTITIGSEDACHYTILKSPSELTEYQFGKLIDSIKKEEWQEIINMNINGFKTADDLLLKIIDRLKKEYFFVEMQPIDYYIYEFDYVDDKERECQ